MKRDDDSKKNFSCWHSSILLDPEGGFTRDLFLECLPGKATGGGNSRNPRVLSMWRNTSDGGGRVSRWSPRKHPPPAETSVLSEDKTTAEDLTRKLLWALCAGSLFLPCLLPLGAFYEPVLPASLRALILPTCAILTLLCTVPASVLIDSACSGTWQERGKQGKPLK